MSGISITRSVDKQRLELAGAAILVFPAWTLLQTPTTSSSGKAVDPFATSCEGVSFDIGEVSGHQPGP
jgi:hypothetical protein